MNRIQWTKEELEAVREILKKTNMSTFLSGFPPQHNAKTSAVIKYDDWEVLEEFIRAAYEDYTQDLI